MPIKVLMPQLGESVTEGTISKWLISIGDEIKEFEPLLEVNTDKVDSEIPSPGDGTLLEILVEEGTVVTVGTTLAWLGDAGEKIPEEDPDSTEVLQSEKSAASSIPDQNLTEVSPSEPVRPGRDKDLGFISP